MQEYRIIGVESSPYAVKVRAVMRYRRIPHRWVARIPQFFDETAHLRPLIMPVVQFPEGDYRTDSTPIIRDLEALHPNQRSVWPTNPANAFLSELVEDMADEWLTKSLFHYRFSRPRDQISGASWVIDDANPEIDSSALESKVVDFIKRQTSRMPIVGCTPKNGPLFELFFTELLERLERFVRTDRFLFGTRPSLGDFGLYGQLNTLANDPTAGELIRTNAPRTGRWIRRIDDLSGVEGHWDDKAMDTVAALAELAGRYYLPFLAANSHAIDSGETSVRLEINGHDYEQPVFRYQAKCFDYLRRRYAALTVESKSELNATLGDTRCLQYLN
jgi:glutathione S-transferase